jgi:hypothetical protein
MKLMAANGVVLLTRMKEEINQNQFALGHAAGGGDIDHSTWAQIVNKYTELNLLMTEAIKEMNSRGITLDSGPVEARVSNVSGH